MIKKLFYGVVFTLMTTFAIAIENSIVPSVERLECLENLSQNKYSRKQYEEIKSALLHKEERIRIVTYNMLFDLYDENLEDVNRWPQRLPRIVEIIEEMNPDVLCVQELYVNQLEALMPYMKDNFSWYAKPCEDGELNGIFYRKNRFELIDSKVWYMTDTPEVASSETLTQLQLKDLKTGLPVTVFNTHLAFSKVEKREFQARFISKKLQSLEQNIPIILTGDLNTFPHRTDLENLPFYDGDYVHRILTQDIVKDAKEVAVLGHLGPMSTFTNQEGDGVPFKGTGTPGVFLDHIYVSQSVQVLAHAVQPATVQGSFPSDHMPVFVDVLIGQTIKD